MKNRQFLAHVLGFVGLGGCATVDPKLDYNRVAQAVQSATGVSITVDPEDESMAQAGVAEILQNGITADEAVRLCVLNNPRLQAAFLRVGIGRADVVQSGLFSNPGLAVTLRFPDGGGLADFEVSLAQNIAELWQIKHRRRTTERDLDQTILTLAREASSAAYNAHSAYVRALQMDRRLEIARENLMIAEQLVTLAAARQEAGSGTEVDVNLVRAERVSLDVASRTSWVAAVEARTNLSKVLGIATLPGDLLLTDPLPETVHLTFTPEQLVEAARTNRPDLKAADAVTQSSAARLVYERSRCLKTVELGISMERGERAAGDPVSTDYVTGPTLNLELPLFDQNQAQIARAEFELLQARYLKEAMDREIVQEAWAVHARAKTAFETSGFMRNELLPLREKGLTLAREAYRVGSTTLLTVLDAQRRLLEARAGYVDVQAAAGLARIDLERIAGQPFARLSAPREPIQSLTSENKP